MFKEVLHLVFSDEEQGGGLRHGIFRFVCFFEASDGEFRLTDAVVVVCAGNEFSQRDVDFGEEGRGCFEEGVGIFVDFFRFQCVGIVVGDACVLDDLFGGGESLHAVNDGVVSFVGGGVVAEVEVHAHHGCGQHGAESSGVFKIESRADVMDELIGVFEIFRI